MLSGPSFSSAFAFSVNSLTSLQLAEASLSAFSWLYIFVCAVFQKDHKMSFVIIIHIFSTHFAINMFYMHNLKTTHRAWEQTKVKQKLNQFTSHSN